MTILRHSRKSQAAVNVPLLLIVMIVVTILGASCDFPPGFGKEKGSLIIALPGANMPLQGSTAALRAVHLPEPVINNMSYTIEFYSSGGNSKVSTREKVILVELEPGYWDIVVTALYGSDMAAIDKIPQVEIRAGQTNTISFTMKADDFITPEITNTGSYSYTLNTTDSAVTLSITLGATTAFSGISGWSDGLTYQRYYEDANGTRTDIDASPVSFSGITPLGYSVDPSVLGVGNFTYSVEISNSYTYTPQGGGSPTSGTMTKSSFVARVEVVI